MTTAWTYRWLELNERRRIVLLSINQPLTATHVARRTGITRDSCQHYLRALMHWGLVQCLNKGTRHNQLYWLTKRGEKYQRKLLTERGSPPLPHRKPDVPWDAYSAVCYRHRSAVIEAMLGHLQACEIKKRSFARDPRVRMSANNVRDVIKYLLGQQIVRKVQVRRRRHPLYELTELGGELKQLLAGIKAP